MQPKTRTLIVWRRLSWFKLPMLGAQAGIRLSFFCILFASGLATPSVTAGLVILYDGNGLPATQSWLAFANDGFLSGGTATQSTQPSGVRLQTDLPVSGGYSNHTPLGQLKNAAFPSLNRSMGFELSFALAVASESHSSNDRAGFSVLLLSSDARGIELAFWGDQIWAQTSTPLFTHGEGVAIDTTPQRNYRLRIVNDNYSLFEGANPLLSGSVRDYTAFGQPPYTRPNFLFLGDNTSRGSADIYLGAVSLQSDLTAVPEPSSILLIAASLMLVVAAKRRWTEF